MSDVKTNAVDDRPAIDLADDFDIVEVSTIRDSVALPETGASSGSSSCGSNSTCGSTSTSSF